MTDVPLVRSIRLIFEFDGDRLRLLQQHPVNAAAGGFRDYQAGDYVEVRNRDGQMVSRVPVWMGVGSSVEVFPEDPYISANASRVLTVVVPAPPGADHVAMVRDGSAGVEVLGTFPLQR